MQALLLALSLAAAARCGPKIAGVEKVSGAPVVLLGEMHGLTAAPAFAGDLACRLARAGKHVTLALEIPKQEQPRIDAYLASAGTAADRAALLAGPFWTAAYQDGRRSVARAELLESVRKLRVEGVAIRVVAFDDTSFKSATREAGIAANVLAARPSNGVELVLVGNLHARTHPGAPWNPKATWMGQLLAAKVPGLLALDNRYLDGQVWMCSGPKPADCGVKPVRGYGHGESWSIELLPARDTAGFDGVFQLGKAIASPPAVAQSKGDAKPAPR